jgi:hypothetical protein
MPIHDIILMLGLCSVLTAIGVSILIAIEYIKGY